MPMILVLAEKHLLLSTHKERILGQLKAQPSRVNVIGATNANDAFALLQEYGDGICVAVLDGTEQESSVFLPLLMKKRPEIPRVAVFDGPTLRSKFCMLGCTHEATRETLPRLMQEIIVELGQIDQPEAEPSQAVQQAILGAYSA